MKDDQHGSLATAGHAVLKSASPSAAGPFSRFRHGGWGQGIVGGQLLMLPARAMLAAEFTTCAATGKTLLDDGPRHLPARQDFGPLLHAGDRALRRGKAAMTRRLPAVSATVVAQLDALARTPSGSPTPRSPLEVQRVTPALRNRARRLLPEDRATWSPVLQQQGGMAFRWRKARPWRKGGYIARGFDDIDWLPSLSLTTHKSGWRQESADTGILAGRRQPWWCIRNRAAAARWLTDSPTRGEQSSSSKPASITPQAISRTTSGR